VAKKPLSKPASSRHVPNYSMTDQFKKQLQSFPSPFLRAMQNNVYTKGDSQFSVTQLIGPPQRTWLATLHEKQETPYSSFAAFLGTAMHAVLEANVDPSQGEIAEERMFATICGAKVSGQLDHLEKKTLFDYKTTRGAQDAMKPDHRTQVNANGYLATLNGHEVEHVAIVYIQMDWSYMQSSLNPLYPQSPYKIFVEDYDQQSAIDFFNRAIPEHLAALEGKPRECTRDEKWQKDDSYALMKTGAKRASKVCSTRAEAESLIKPGQFIQERPGERTFCSSFCGFNQCPQKKREDAKSVKPEEP
jgi:hypothetical protein